MDNFHLNHCMIGLVDFLQVMVGLVDFLHVMVGLVEFLRLDLVDFLEVRFC